MKYLDQTGLGYLWTKIKAKLAEKQNTLTFDSTPTSGSTNPVTSGGVYTALGGKVSKAGDTMTGDLVITKNGEYPSLIFNKVTNPTTSPQQMIQPIGGTSLTGSRIGFYQKLNGSSAWEGYRLPNTNESLSSAVNYDIITSKTFDPSTVGIVATGTTAPQAITAGQYVIWQGSLYTAKSNIASGATLSTSNLTAVSGGGLNQFAFSTADWTPTITFGGNITTASVSGQWFKQGHLVFFTCRFNITAVSGSDILVFSLPSGLSGFTNAVGARGELQRNYAHNDDVIIRYANNSLQASNVSGGGISLSTGWHTMFATVFIGL